MANKNGRSRVVWQTGKKEKHLIVLSDDTIQYKIAQKRTVRYQYAKVGLEWCAWVCGPFHSRTYGACGFGTKRRFAKVALRRGLANRFGYIGRVSFSTVDEADNVGNVNPRLLDESASARPLTFSDVCGSAGM
jgi:hypothetical protein